MKILLRSKENNSLSLVDTNDEPRYKELYNDESGVPLPVETVGTEIQESDIMVQKTVVVDVPDVAPKKRGRKPGKSIAKKSK